MERNESSQVRISILTALLLVGIFAAGVVTGAGLIRWFAPRPMRPPRGGLPPPFAELGLTNDQERQAMQIMEKHRGELDAILSETFPKARAVHETVEKEIREILSPVQQKKLDDLKTRRPPPPRGPMPFPPPGAPPGPPSGPPPPMSH